MQLTTFFKLNQYCLEQGLFWLQGPGGNTSIKDLKTQTLYVKPSGYRLEKVKSEADLSKVKLDQFLNKFLIVKTAISEDEKEKNYKELIEQCNLTAERRPSMETGFHAVMKSTYVFHIHSLVAVLIGDMTGEEKIKFKSWYHQNWFEKLGSFAEIEATMPGAQLAIILEKCSEIPVVFLKNHGAILQFTNENFLQTYQSFELAVLKEFFPKAILFRTLKTFPKDLLSGPLKFYFPDFVILYPRLKPYLKKVDADTYELSAETQSKDLDVYENWMATQILYHMKPNLKELPSEIIEKVPHLPTELVRKKIMETP